MNKTLIRSLVAISFSLLVLFADARGTYAGADDDNSVAGYLQKPEKKVILTIYDDSQALFSESRPAQFKDGSFTLTFDNVPETLKLDSVIIIPEKEKSFQAVSTRFEFDIASKRDLNLHYIGRDVELSDNAQPDKKITARYLYGKEDFDVFYTGDRYLINPDFSIIYADGVNDLRLIPALIVDAKAGADTADNVNLIYLADKISYKTEYSIIMDEAGGSPYFHANIIITNDTIDGFFCDNLSLVQMEEVSTESARREKTIDAMLGEAGITREDCLKNIHAVNIQKDFIINKYSTRSFTWINSGLNDYSQLCVYDDMPVSLSKREAPVTGFLKKAINIKNNENNRINSDLLAGQFKIFNKKKNGAVFLVKENRLPFTKKGEDIMIDLGDEKGVAFERKRTEFERVERGEYKISYELSVTNDTPKDENVQIIEHLPKGFNILQSDTKYEETSEDTITYNAIVNANSKLIINYTFELTK